MQRDVDGYLSEDELIQITVGNDRFHNSQDRMADFLINRAAGQELSSSRKCSAEQLISEQHDFAEETASMAKAKEMAARTREMLTKLGGWKQIGLQPQASIESERPSDRPGIMNVSNSAYTVVSAKSETAQNIMKNISDMASILCPQGGVAHYKYLANASGDKSNQLDDEDKFLYGNNLEHSNISKRGVQHVSETIPGFNSGSELSDMNRSKSPDPIVAQMLKSIGFNFELSKLMQDKAKQEKEMTELCAVEQATSYLQKNPNKSEQSVLKGFEMVGKEKRIAGLKRHEKSVLYDDFSDNDSSGSDQQRLDVVPPVVQPATTPALPGMILPNMAFPPPPVHLPPVVLPVLPQHPPQWPYATQRHASYPERKEVSSRRTDELEWEMSTRDFLRKLEEPRAVEKPKKSDVVRLVDISDSSNSSDELGYRKEQDQASFDVNEPHRFSANRLDRQDSGNRLKLEMRKSSERQRYDGRYMGNRRSEERRREEDRKNRKSEERRRLEERRNRRSEEMWIPQVSQKSSDRRISKDKRRSEERWRKEVRQRSEDRRKSVENSRLVVKQKYVDEPRSVKDRRSRDQQNPVEKSSEKLNSPKREKWSESRKLSGGKSILNEDQVESDAGQTSTVRLVESSQRSNELVEKSASCEEQKTSDEGNSRSLKPEDPEKVDQGLGLKRSPENKLSELQLKLDKLRDEFAQLRRSNSSNSHQAMINNSILQDKLRQEIYMLRQTKVGSYNFVLLIFLFGAR